MRINTELSEMPPAFTVNKEGETAVIRFYTDVQEDTRDGEVVYTTTAWTATFPWISSLQERIEAAPNTWLNAIKEASTAEAAAEIRAKRDALLLESDSRVALDRLGLEVPSGTTFSAWLSFFNTLGAVLSGKWATYRQALRDIPQQDGFPFNVVWPAKPED